MQMSQCALAWLAACAVFAAPGGLRADDEKQAADKAEIGKPAPDFELKTTEGRTKKLSEFKDKLVVLEWWNQDCPICVACIPTMKELHKKYSEKDVVWLAIDSTHYQTAEKDAKYKKEKEIPYPILMDADGTVGRTYGARTTPHMFVIDKGTLVYSGAIDNGSPRQRGSRNYVAEVLDALLAGKDVPIDTSKPYGCSVKYARKSP